MIEDGEKQWALEAQIAETSDDLMLLVNALRFPVEHGSGRTETWWKLYVSAIARKLELIANKNPGLLKSVCEFNKNIKEGRQ